MAVINALGPLVKTRHTLSSKIINTFLSVDIINIPQNSPDPAKAQLQLRSVSKVLRIQLSHFLKYYPHPPSPFVTDVDIFVGQMPLDHYRVG